MKHLLKLFWIVGILAKSFSITVASGFANGQFYVISSATSSKVLTAGTTGSFSRGASVVLTLWNDDANQKWLALEAPAIVQISPTAREIQTSRYFLVPQQQEFDWSKVTQNGAKNITSTNDLPPFTEVLSIDSVTGNLTTEVFNQSSSSQAWIPEEVGVDGQIFIRNLGNNQCIKNFDKPANLIQRIFSFIRRIRQHQKHVPNPLSTFDCNVKDATERWIAEL